MKKPVYVTNSMPPFSIGVIIIRSNKKETKKMNRDDIIHDEVGECLSNTFWHCTNVAQIRGLYKNIINVRIKYKVYKHAL